MVKTTLKVIPLLFAFTLLIFSACKEPIEGCQDVAAENYSVAADNPCEDCCTYPTISLEISHRFQDSLRFSYDSIYYFEGNTPSRFEQVIFYCANFKLIGENDTLEVVDTMTFDIIGAGTELFKDDFVLIERNLGSQYTVGEIREAGTFTKISFDVGLRDNAEIINAETVAEDHPLYLTEDTLWTYPNGYVFNHIMMIPDTNTIDGDTLILDIKGQTRLQTIELDYELSIDRGFSATIPLKIDYYQWFMGINFATMNSEDIMTEIVNQTPNAFSIAE